MQGCCCALALVERGLDVTIFDRNDHLLSRAAVANEGKIHLGYMYANDLSHSTARVMMQGALAFAPFLERHLGISAQSLHLSNPAAYVVHCDSQRSAEQIAEYLTIVHTMILDAAAGRPEAYFGRDLSQKPRPWSVAEREAKFDGEIAVAVFDTPEVAVNAVALAQTLRRRIHDDPRIEVRLAHRVLSIEDIDHPIVVAQDPGAIARHRFDHVINALWDGRMAINDTLGFRANRAWLHRLKYGVSFYLPALANRPPSATFVSGPFGEVVSYHDGLIYLTWYPVCLAAISRDIAPPEWPTYPDEPLRSKLVRDTLGAMGRIVLALRDLHPEALVDVSVKGGPIVAWGETDIYDPKSELHRRYEIGVTSDRRFHSVDPGKLTMAPYFAHLCADRLLASCRA
jgi:glycine/D-amino acid oxidase-like deaminating enzyme